MSALTPIQLPAAVTHPWGLLAVQIFVYGAASFTKPTSFVRNVAIVVMVTVACYFHFIVHERMENRLWKTFPSGIAVGAVLTAFERLLLRRWNYEAGGPEEYLNKGKTTGSVGAKKTIHPPLNTPAKSRFWFALDTVFSVRGVSKPWQVKNVPRFSSTDPSYVPSRRAFLLRKLALILLCFMIYDLLAAQPPPEERLVAASKQPFFRRFHDMTSEELGFRIACTLGFWISTAALLNLFTETFAFVVVFLGISKPAAWLPSFDSPTEAYSIRQFWGLACLLQLSPSVADFRCRVYWHQKLRAMVEGISRFVTHSVLQIPQSTILARYSNIFIAFFLSGLIHVASDHGQTIPIHESGAIQFFVTQALGIMIEDGFQAVYYSLTGKRRPSKAPVLHRVVGYLWLVLFLTWSTPVWTYPLIRTVRKGVDVLFPFTIFGHFGGK